MESILRELGAVNENESDVQRSILRERVLKTIRFPKVKDELPCHDSLSVIGGFPELSRESHLSILSALRREEENCRPFHGASIPHDIAIMKLKSFEYLVGQISSENDVVSSTTPYVGDGTQNRSIANTSRRLPNSNINRPEVKFVSLNQIGKSPGHSLSSSSSYSKVGVSSSSNLGLNDLNLHVHGKIRLAQKWNIDDSAISQLNSEARNGIRDSSSRSFIVEGDRASLSVEEDTQSIKHESLGVTRCANVTPISSFAMEEAGEHIDGSEERTVKGNKKLHLVEGKRSSNKRVRRENKLSPPNEKKTSRCRGSDQPVGESVTCPICNNALPIGKLSAAIVLDKHIDRCMRRSETTISKTHENESVSDEIDEEKEDIHSPLDLAIKDERKSNHSNSHRLRERKFKSVYTESRSESEDDENESSDTLSNGGNSDRLEDTDDDDDDDEDEDDLPISKANQKKSKNTSYSKAAKAKNKKVPVMKSFIAEPILKGKDKRKADKLMKEIKGRGMNCKGLIEEDRVEVFDDWEDDFYLGRLKAIGLNGFVDKSVKVKSEGGADKLDHDKDDKPDAMEELHAHQGYELIDDSLDVDKKTWKDLFEYQREGVKWLNSLYESGVGGILGDEMGLGKTAQLCCHFGSLSRKHRKLRGKNGIFLVVCPATVLQHWLKEFHRWVPALRVIIMHSISKTGAEVQQLTESAVEYVLRKLQRFEGTQGLVVLITYDGLRRRKESLSMLEWTGVCLDEGQKIRNPETDVAAVCKVLPSYHRIILSGTPIQNSLRELWSLFDFIYPGRLGALTVFELEFCEPIRAGGYRNASKLQAEVAVRCAATLQRIVRPYLLRRKKDDLSAITKLPKKIEQVLFCKLSERQKDIYRSILASSEVQSVIDKKMMPFRAINTLRKLCNHPDLVFQSGRIVWQDEQTKNTSKSKALKDSKKKDKRVRDWEDQPEDELETEEAHLDPSNVKWEDSGKLMVLYKVLPLWYSEGHKVLLFTQTHSMLNLLELMMKQFAFRFMRLDGMTPVSKREGIIETFNKDPTVFLMILTTRTGGVGISLTAANRVVLIDPDWNPQTDVQARERAWRLGQLRDVTIYRLICRGTIEEKIYQRQIFKLLLTSRILDDPKQKALFTKSDIKELFNFEDDDTPNNKTGVKIKSDLPDEGKIKLADNVATNHAESDLVDVEDDEAVQSKSSYSMDSEIFVEQEIFPITTTSLSSSSSVSGAKVDSAGDDQDSNSRDRRLLQALFDGEALSAVYDHSYIEPGMGGSDAAREARAVQEQASAAVDQALMQLQASAPSYRSTDQRSAPVQNTARIPDKPLAPPNRFGGTSSARMLAGLRASQMSTETRSIVPSSSTSRDTASSTVTVQRSADTVAPTSVSAVTITAPKSISADILGRLEVLFFPGKRKTECGLATNTILEHFGDLGDQYASLFRDSLHQIAALKNGRWYPH